MQKKGKLADRFYTWGKQREKSMVTPDLWLNSDSHAIYGERNKFQMGLRNQMYDCGYTKFTMPINGLPKRRFYIKIIWLIIKEKV